VNSRQLSKTNLRVSEVGFGAWGISGATPGPPLMEKPMSRLLG